MTIGRASYEPVGNGRSTSARHGRDLLQRRTRRLVISGSAACQMNDGRYYEMKAGDLFYIGPATTVGGRRRAVRLSPFPRGGALRPICFCS